MTAAHLKQQQALNLSFGDENTIDRGMKDVETEAANCKEEFVETHDRHKDRKCIIKVYKMNIIIKKGYKLGF